MGNGQVILVVHVLVHETIVSKRHTSNPDDSYHPKLL